MNSPVALQELFFELRNLSGNLGTWNFLALRKPLTPGVIFSDNIWNMEYAVCHSVSGLLVNILQECKDEVGVDVCVLPISNHNTVVFVLKP